MQYQVMLPLVQYVLIHWTTNSYQTVCVLIRKEHFIALTKLDSTLAVFFLTLLFVLTQPVSLFANFRVTNRVINFSGPANSAPSNELFI